MKPNSFIKSFISTNENDIIALTNNDSTIVKNEWNNNPLFINFINSFFNEFVDFETLFISDLSGHFYDSNKPLLNNSEYSPFYETNIKQMLKSYLLLSVEFYLNLNNKYKSECINPFLEDVSTKLMELQCDKCGTTIHIALNFEKNTLETTNFFSKYSNGKRCSEDKNDEIIKYSIKTPSQKMVFSSIFNQILNEKQINSLKQSTSLSSFKGIKERCKLWSDLNIMLIYGDDLVLTRSGNNFNLVSYYLIDCDIEDFDINSIGEDLGYIYGDTHTTSAMDYHQFLTLCNNNDINPDSIDKIVVECGSAYNFTDFLNTRNDGIVATLKLS